MRYCCIWLPTLLWHTLTLESLISSNPTSGNGQEPGKHPLRLTRFQVRILFLFCIIFRSVRRTRYLVRISWPICEQGFNLSMTSLFICCRFSSTWCKLSIPWEPWIHTVQGYGLVLAHHTEQEAAPSSSRACAWRLHNGFPENKKKKPHTGAHLNSCRPSMSARNFSGLLTNYSS